MGVINQEAADLYFSGKPLDVGVIDDGGVRTEIIGVVKSQVFGTFEQHAEPTIYLPMWQDCPLRMTLILKTRSGIAPLQPIFERKLKPRQGADQRRLQSIPSIPN